MNPQTDHLNTLMGTPAECLLRDLRPPVAIKLSKLPAPRRCVTRPFPKIASCITPPAKIMGCGRRHCHITSSPRGVITLEGRGVLAVCQTKLSSMHGKNNVHLLSS